MHKLHNPIQKSYAQYYIIDHTQFNNGIDLLSKSIKVPFSNIFQFNIY